MSDSPIERARKLAALATDPSASPHEARNAAMACCKLIAAHGLLGGHNGAPHPAPAREPQWKKDFVDIGTRVAQGSFQNFVQEMFRAAQQAEQMRRPPPGSPPPRKVDKRDRAARIEEEFRQMRFRTPEAISDEKLRRVVEASVDMAMAREADETRRKPKHGGGGRVP